MSASDPMKGADERADAAFELFRILDVPYFTFHDRDIALQRVGFKRLSGKFTLSLQTILFMRT